MSELFWVICNFLLVHLKYFLETKLAKTLVQMNNRKIRSRNRKQLQGKAKKLGFWRKKNVKQRWKQMLFAVAGGRRGTVENVPYNKFDVKYGTLYIPLWVVFLLFLLCLSSFVVFLIYSVLSIPNFLKSWTKVHLKFKLFADSIEYSEELLLLLLLPSQQWRIVPLNFMLHFLSNFFFPFNHLFLLLFFFFSGRCPKKLNSWH